MKLAASLIVRNERGRYLEPCIDHLAEFCDLIVVWDDGSDDGTLDALNGRNPQIRLHGRGRSEFFNHEGKARQALFEATLSWEPTHVLAVDADEFVSDGPLLRKIVEASDADAFALEMCEVWKVFDECLCIRQDGGWRAHPIPALWRVPPDPSRLRIADRALACGRVPEIVDRTRPIDTGAALFHFGWSNQVERIARHQRYAVADGGRFHASSHLDSILWPDEQVAMYSCEWPVALHAQKAHILGRANTSSE